MRLWADLAVSDLEGLPEGSWFAVRDGLVVGTGDSPGLARRDARRRGPADCPTVVRQV